MFPFELQFQLEVEVTTEPILLPHLNIPRASSQFCYHTISTRSHFCHHTFASFKPAASSAATPFQQRAISAIVNASPIINKRRDFPAADTITVNIRIVGRGLTGTYSAVRLSQDLGKTVIVIEKSNVLGGYTNTFIDPVTNFPVDYRNFSLPQLESIVTGSYPTTARYDNSELYQKAAALLGSSVLYGNTLVRTERHINGSYYITVQTPTGLKLIKAKKLLITIPPILDNLTPFELDHHEHSVFSQWQYTNYYTGIIRGGIPANTSIVNTAANSPLNIPTSPYVLHFSYSGIPNLHTFSTVSTSPQTLSQTETLINSDISLLQKSGTVPACRATIVVINNHTPIQMRVPADSIKKGFYSDLYALQGRHGTFWTGAAWAPDDSSLLWEFTEGILPLVVKALE
ncbi:hypothetical protein BGZ57DRAFT_995365 [Hyaloscypha finlandica]|nr:hypothetical protein BGZ57DRAFT_995365 [Hyaloscypha finlandica]